MELLILSNLILTFSVLFLLSKVFGKKGSIFIANFNIIFCFFSILFIFLEHFIWHEEFFIEYLKIDNWFLIFGIDTIHLYLLLDNLSITMLLAVITISACVHVYSTYYMEADKNIVKFFSYLTLFTFFMCVLVTASNFFMLFVGWEGVGICSFLLISFWNSRVQANKSALKAMLINRVGDFFLLIAMVFIILTFQTSEYTAVFPQIPLHITKSLLVFLNYNLTIIDLISIFIVLGAITKSAQLGLHGWLPDAMEGPTPVSALIHAATMVTAGVFLLVRTSFIIEFSEVALTFLVYIGSLTAFIFGVVAFFQYDIKKIIAFSTCSQLGFMTLACGLSSYNVAFFHLFTHSAFKALLFLSAGSYIHLMNNEQDIRKMGKAFEKSPVLSVFFIIGSFTLMGFPFLSSFFSKEPILQLAFLYNDNLAIFILAQVGSVFTLLYSFKIFYYLYFKKNFNKSFFKLNLSKTPTFIYSSSVLLFLCSLSVFLGYFTKTFFIGVGSNFFYGNIFILHSKILDYDFVPFYIKVLPLISLIVVMVLFYKICVYIQSENMSRYFINYNLFLFFNKRMFFDSLLNLFIVFPLYKVSYKIFFLFDKGLLELLGNYGISVFINRFNSCSYKIFESDNFQTIVIIVFCTLISLILSILIVIDYTTYL